MRYQGTIGETITEKNHVCSQNRRHQLRQLRNEKLRFACSHHFFLKAKIEVLL